jgi:transposase
MRSWLPADHPVFWVIEVVGRLDTTALHAQRRTGGVGRAGYDPDMLLTLLIWAWAQGQRSSRVIERCCQQDLAYRIICAGDAPDHVTISRFRAALDTAVQDLFAQVLVLCAQLGMGRLGVVALDGVKIASNASMSANRTEDGLRKAAAAEAMRAAKAQAAAASAQHAATDQGEDDLFGPGTRPDTVPDDGDNGPAGGAGPAGEPPPGSRAARIEQALAIVQAEKESRTAAKQKLRPRTGAPTQYQIDRAENRLAIERAKQQKIVDDFDIYYRNYVKEMRIKPDGAHPTPVEERSRVVRAKAAVDKLHARAEQAAEQGEPEDTTGREPAANTTDPQSRLMPLRGGGWLQGYNCQALTSSDGLILATSVSNNPVDTPTFIPMMTAGIAAATAMHPTTSPADAEPPPHGGIGMLLADAGYLSHANLTAAGPDRLIAVGKRRAMEAAARAHPTQDPPPPDADPIAVMTHRLRTPEGIAAYRQRSHIAETPFGHAKHNLGFRRFTGRGTTRATAEFAFHAMVHNLTKAFTHTAITNTP